MSYVYGTTVPNSEPVEYSESNQTETEQAGGGGTNTSTVSAVKIAGIEIPVWLLALLAVLGLVFLLLKLVKK